ncbi:MAG: bifunctional DNA-formamidopyrimidine glycosylase/DNA-(apurinic or apyrimidinic site) lyase [Alphaproteobacteria bacterium]|nr:bifunctional DNA-formamidopyrimidine glycosylase/DNA-(apurinic or apyrimidinic site) lyase [Alphaproteobacteria bacterium]
MPELPEVETVRRGLFPVMKDARFERVMLRRADLRFPLPRRFHERLEGARVLGLERRGKYLIAPLSTGETLVMHLGMSGRFTVTAGEARRPDAFSSAKAPDPRHDHVIFVMAGKSGRASIIYNDPRRFGFMDLADSARLGASRHFASMGPEPLGADFTADAFNAALAARRSSVKAALLDQKVVAGVGNIYACEALFKAGISPRRAARSVSGVRGERLRSALREVLEEAIRAGGSSLKDFAAADGALGYFQHRFKVYDREGRACPRCGAEIRRIIQSGRSTFLCGGCQR